MSLFDQWVTICLLHCKMDKRTRVAKKIERGLLHLFWTDATDAELIESARGIANLLELNVKETLEVLKRKRFEARRIYYPSEYN